MPALRTLLTPFLLWWRYWPQLAACYLAGLVVRRAVIAAAAWTGHRNPLWAALMMPCAGLAQLGSYVAMFLVLRTGIPALAALPRRPLRSVDLFTNVIVPFFAIYLGWQMFKEDWLAYQRLALNYRVADALSGVNTEMLPVSRVTWVIVGAALAARFVLAHFSGRLPAVLTAVRVYIDALWVFLVLTFSLAAGITFLIKPGEWLSQRRLVVWFNNLRGDAFSHFQVLESAWQSLMWLVRTAFGGAAVPLMWLAAAGIVYGVSTQIDWPAMLRRPAPGARRSGGRVRPALAEGSRAAAVARLGVRAIEDRAVRPDRRRGPADPARRPGRTVGIRAGLPRTGVAGHAGQLLPDPVDRGLPVPGHGEDTGPAWPGVLVGVRRHHGSDLAADRATAAHRPHHRDVRLLRAPRQRRRG